MKWNEKNSIEQENTFHFIASYKNMLDKIFLVEMKCA